MGVGGCGGRYPAPEGRQIGTPPGMFLTPSLTLETLSIFGNILWSKRFFYTCYPQVELCDEQEEVKLLQSTDDNYFMVAITTTEGQSRGEKK